MAVRGRKPKPTAIKLLEGNPGKRPLNESEPLPPQGQIKCPSWLLPEAKQATGAIALNFAANMLGMGNAATPFGLEAMRLMQLENKNKTTATGTMCAFLAINASALEIIPTTMIGLRAAYGSASPAAIVLPTLISSGTATFVTVLICRRLLKKR